MKKVLIVGLGRSSSVLIEYFLKYSQTNDVHIVLLDQYKNDFLDTFKNLSSCSLLFFDIHNNEKRSNQIKESDLVISMLPTRFHYLIAKDCIY